MSPSSPSFVKTSRGNSCFSSHSRAWGPISASAKERTVSLRSRCSSLIPKSKGGPPPAGRDEAERSILIYILEAPSPAGRGRRARPGGGGGGGVRGSPLARRG